MSALPARLVCAGILTLLASACGENADDVSPPSISADSEQTAYHGIDTEDGFASDLIEGVLNIERAGNGTLCLTLTQTNQASNDSSSATLLAFDRKAALMAEDGRVTVSWVDYSVDASEGESVGFAGKLSSNEDFEQLERNGCDPALRVWLVG